MKFTVMSSSSSSSSPLSSSASAKKSTTAASHKTTSKLRKHSATTSAGYYQNQQNAQRKRTKRQAAGGLVSTLFSRPSSSSAASLQQQQAPSPSPPPHQGPVKLTPSGKKSTAQPRPQVTVPPRGIGPVYQPNDDDVLCGRGGRINAHVGNQRFRLIVTQRKPEYLAPSTKKLAKAHIAAHVVQDIRQRGGRFLKEDSDGAWYDIGDAKAIKKVGQALREDAQEVKSGGGLSDDDNAGTPPASVAATATKAATPVNKVSVALPQGALQSQKPSSSQSLHDTGSVTYDPLPYTTTGAVSSNQGLHHAMGPPLAVPPQQPQPQHQYRTQRTEGASAAAHTAMREDSSGHFSATTGMAFDHVFHPTIAMTTEGSAISGLTNTVVSGTSDFSLPNHRGGGGGGRGSFTSSPHAAHHHHLTNPTVQALRAQQLHLFRQSMEGGAPPQPPQFHPRTAASSRPGVLRSASWHDGASYADNMSWAEHSLAGGGIPETGSVLSAQSFYSYQMRNDSSDMSILEALMQGSVGSSRRSQPPTGGGPAPLPPAYPYAAHLYQRSPAPQALGRLTSPASSSNHPTSGSSGGASVASMSVTSAGMASLGSIKSIMSDLSENLIALDLAEPRHQF